MDNTQIKKVYEAPKAEISKISEFDILSVSSPKGEWDSQSTVRKINF